MKWTLAPVVGLVAVCPVVAVGSEAVQAEEADKAVAPAEPWWRGTFEEEIQLIALDRTWGDATTDEDLAGLRLTYRMWEDQYDDMMGIGSGGYYFGMKRTGDRQGLDAGAELIFMNIGLGPVRMGPRLRVGAEYWGAEPGQGLGAVVSGGFQVACWLTKRVQLAVLAEREAGSHSGTGNVFAVSIGVAVGRAPL